MSLSFEWNAQKASANARKHGVSFDEAATAFGDPLSVTISDPDHSGGEERYVLMGSTYRDRIMVVVHTNRGDNIRIISARRATRTERRKYDD